MGKLGFGTACFWGALMSGFPLFAAAADVIPLNGAFQKGSDFQKSGDELRVIESSVGSGGIQHIRYVQFHRGIPVYQHQMVAHVKGTKSGLSRVHWTGQYIAGIDRDIRKSISHYNYKNKPSKNWLTELEKAYLTSHHISPKQPVSFQGAVNQLVYYVDAQNKAHLGYDVHFFVEGEGLGAHRPYYLIDAETQTVVRHWEGLTSEKVGRGPGGNLKTGLYEYGQDKDFLDITVAEEGCFLENEHVRTLDLKNGWGTSASIPTSFACYRHAGDDMNGAFSPANDGHYLASKVFEMYQAWYGIPPVNGQLIVRVHYLWEMENAFWNGHSVSFGDGGENFYPFTVADVVGHEVGHGFTEQHSGLQYFGQSGAINESFSDMSGKATAFYMGELEDWTVSKNANKGEFAMRWLDQPTRDGHSIEDARDYDEELDVHETSGVFNKAFYLLATTKNTSGFEWDPRKSFDVFVDANWHYWTPLSDYTDAAQGVIHAASDRGYPVQDVIAAFDGVGIQCSTTAVCEIKPKANETEQNTADTMPEESPAALRSEA